MLVPNGRGGGGFKNKMDQNFLFGFWSLNVNVIPSILLRLELLWKKRNCEENLLTLRKRKKKCFGRQFYMVAYTFFIVDLCRVFCTKCSRENGHTCCNQTYYFFGYLNIITATVSRIPPEKILEFIFLFHLFT